MNKYLNKFIMLIFNFKHKTVQVLKSSFLFSIKVLLKTFYSQIKDLYRYMGLWSKWSKVAGYFVYILSVLISSLI